MKYCITDSEISYKLYGDNLKGDIICILTGIALGFSGWWYATVESGDKEAGFALFVIGIIAVFIGIFRMLAYDLLEIIFDASTRCIYKKQPWSSRWTVLTFDRISGIFTTSEYGHFYYCFSIDGKRFGRGTRFSNDFRSGRKRKKDRILFEDEVLPSVLEMIGTERDENS